ncbi:MAG: mycothiol system anti-sigma-R factor [Actinomycetota bacterium]|nr:mycothiol system anti-sigma-R factor [Actinomycetota bacterium]
MRATCSDTVSEVYVYLDNEVTWFRRRRVQRHLSKCPPCERAFEFERKLKGVVRQRTAEPPPPELVDRLRAFLRENGVGGV